MKENLKTPRSEGVTDAERYLKKLCDHSFLSMWSYTGVFNDKSNGQEVCDLLVVFDNHLIIFSDKDCEYPNTGNDELDWKRWYKKAVKKSADQVYGAERWIINHPNRLFLDQTCKIPFPLDLPSLDIVKVHRIVVAHSASAKCKEYFGGSGSLIIDTDVLGDEALFRIGKVESEKGFIHVFDDTTLDIILETLDTISDFVDYLSRKEKFLTGDLRISAAGEEELLALYLKNTNENDEHDFVFEKDINSLGGIFLSEGFWEEFSRNLQRKAQISANRISYFWDWLIENFTQHFRNGTSYYNTHETVKDQEQLLRLLARENRTRRRFLSNAFLEFVGKVNPALKASRILLPDNENDPHYVFLVLPETNDIPYEKYREIRREMLLTHCLITKLDFPNAKDVIGIATESGKAKQESQDLIYYDARNWSYKEKKDAEKLKSDLIRVGLLNPQHMFEKTEYEYPKLNAPIDIRHRTIIKGKHLNKPCRCGSGKKTKKCCGLL
jgi:hypothetical protein